MYHQAHVWEIQNHANSLYKLNHQSNVYHNVQTRHISIRTIKAFAYTHVVKLILLVYTIKLLEKILDAYKETAQNHKRWSRTSMIMMK